MPATANETITVRVSRETHNTLRELSDQSGESMSQIVARAVERYRRARFIEEANRAWAKIIEEDPKVQEEYLELQRELEGTLNDGLEDIPW